MTKTLENLKVLLVDDSRSSNAILSALLTGIGLQRKNISTISTPEETIGFLGKSFVDILLIDFHLETNLNGVQLTKSLRKLKLLNDQTEVMVISGDSSQETILNILSSQVYYFLLKPVSKQGIKQKLEKILENQSSLQEFHQQQAKGSEFKLPSHYNPIIESILIEQLIEQQSFEDLATLLQLSETKSHEKKVLAQAILNQQNGKVEEAESLALSVIETTPTAHSLLHFMVCSKFDAQRYEDALEYATRLDLLCPQQTEYTLLLCQLAAKLNNFKLFFDKAKICLKYMPIYDNSWLHYIFTLNRDFLMLFSKLAKQQDQQKFIKAYQSLMHIHEERIIRKQLPTFRLNIQLLYAQLMLVKQSPDKAKQHILQGFKGQYNTINSLPSELLILSLELLSKVEETWLIKMLLTSLLNRQNFEENDRQRLNQFLQNQDLLQKLIKIDDLLHNLETLESNPEKLSKYQALIKIAPYNSEVQLAHLSAVFLCSEGPTDSTPALEQRIAKLPLAPVLEEWKEILLSRQILKIQAYQQQLNQRSEKFISLKQILKEFISKGN